MTASRSRVYVDTPVASARDPSSRHSMFASQSELDRTARPSSTASSTLPPITSGSVDRLTSLAEGEDKKQKKKKKHRFSFGNLSGSTLSLKPLFGSGRRKSVDSASQTDVVEVGVSTVAVQTQNAPTVDVPVQTSFVAWDGRRAFNGSALTARSFKGSLPPVAVCDQKTSEKVPRQNDSSSTRVAQVESGEPQPGLQSSGSVLSVYEVPTGEPAGATAASDKSPSFLPAGEPRSSPAVESKSDGGKGAFPSEGVTTSSGDLVSGSPRLSPHREISKSSAPGKAEVPERCPSRNKTVQFNLPDCFDCHEEPAKPILERKRNVDEEFEALLRDLDIITDSSDDINISCRNIQQRILPPIQIKPIFDVFRSEYLAPIPENNEPHDTIENSHYQHTEIPSSKNLLNHIDNFTEIKNPLRHIETDNLPDGSIEPDSRRLSRSKPSDRNSIREISADSVKTLPPLAPTKLDISVIYPTEHSAYIYEPGIKQEEEDSTKQPPEKTAAMPTLPSFFETCGSADDAGSTDPGKCQDYDAPQQQQNGDRRQSLESECDIKLRFSRSNSCNSTRSSTLSGFDALCDSSLRFDSCENLERLEDEIIRSLCTPVRELEEEMNGARGDDSDSATEVNLNREASNRRRAILDKLLGGVSAEEPVFSHDSYSEKSGKFAVGIPQKYTATLTRIEHVTDEQSTVGNHLDLTDSYLDNSSVPQVPSHNSSLVSVPAEFPAHIETLSPKKTSLFLFPDVNSQTSEVSSVEVQVPNNVPSRLEVRRSSWSVPSCESRKSPVENVSTHLGDVTENKPVTEDETRGRCEYTNCVKPSQMQNSPFTASGPFVDLGSRPLTPRGSVRAATPSRNDSPCGPKAPNESTENCDYASCLKPSQVHNSLFTAELSELRSSNQPPKRPVSPLPVTSSCQEMSTASANNTNEFFKAKKEEDAAEPDIKVTSELQITLKSPSEKTPIDNRPCDDQSTSRLPTPTPPPPPPPPPPKNYVPQRSPSSESETLQSQRNGGLDGGSMGAMIRAQHSKLVTREVDGNKPFAPPKSPMMVELERRFESRQRSVERQGEDDSRRGEEGGCPAGVVGKGIEAEDDHVDYSLNSETGTNRVWQNVSPVNNTNKLQNGNSAMPSDQQERWSKSPENVYHTSYQNGVNGQRNMQFAPTTIITDEPPPPGAVLVDKKVTVDGDKIHTDKYYAIPVKEVLKETTSTTKFIPAPPKYEGIGPTEEGIPTGLRHSVKKENMHNWYKTMYKSLHKADENIDDTQEYIIGYTSEPETRKDIMIRKKSATLDNRQRNETRLNNVHLTQAYPSAKSTIDVYNVHPRLIEDYEPGQSSVTDNCITYGSKRFLPAMNVPKPSYVFKKGYESDTTLTKKSPQPESLDEEQQKVWYRQVQRGGDVPQFGFGKVVPERPKDPVIGPPPPPPMNYHPRQPTYQEATRPTTLPYEYSNQNGNSLCQQPNGIYETQIRQALHSEMQRRMSPSSQQLSPPNRSMSKSPSKSPEIRTPSRALFNFNAESPKELSLKKGEMVLILRQLDKNWYEGEKKGTVGIFPINYVEIVPPEHISFPTKSSVEGLGKALYDFKAQTPVEISVRKGDTVAIIRRVDVNWYEGRIANKKGIIPVSYIQILQQPYESKTNSPSPKAFTDSRSRSASKERTQNTSNASPVYTTHSPNSDYVSDNRNKFQNRSKKGNSLIEPVLYRAVYSYSPQNSDELELLEGDTIYVIEMCDDGWYVGTSVRTGVFGIFPGNYLEKV